MFNNKLANAILAFVIAIGLWSYVIYAVNPQQKETFRDVPVQLVNEDILNSKGLAVSNSTAVTVDIAVEGSRKVLASMDKNSFTATADVSECVTGTNNVAVEIKTNKNASLASGNAIIVQINVEKLVTQSKDIKVVYTADAGSDKEIESELTGAAKISISGAESLVEDVAYVAAKVDMGEVKTAEQLVTAKLVPVDSENNTVENIELAYDTTDVKVSIYNIKTVPLTVNITGEPADGYRYTGFKAVDTIVIRGEESILENISSVSTEYININGFTATTEVKPDLSLRDGTELSSEEKPPTVKIYIEGNSAAEISIRSSSINIRNLDENSYTAKIISGAVDISVTGNTKLSESDFSLSINVKGLEPGEHEVPLAVKYKGNGSIVSAPDTVIVRISEKE